MESLTVSASRLQYVLSAWASGAEKDAAAAKCSAMMAIIGEVTPNTLENQRGQALLHYLLDASRPVANVAAIFTQKATLVLHPGDRTVTLPEPVEGHVVKVVSTGDASFVTALKDTLGAHTLGAALKEVSIQEGGFAKSVVDAVGAICSVETQVELAPFMGQLLFVKDDAAMMSVEKAASLCTAVFRRFARGLLEDEIAKASPKTLFQLRELLCQKLEQPNAIHGLERLEDVADFSLAAGLTPSIFQQGCFVSQIQVSQEDIQGKTNIPLRGGVLVVRYGVKHRSSTAFFARTLVVEENASADAKDAYEFVTQVSDKVVELLRPGASLQEVYAAVLAHATELNPTFATHLSRSLGFSTGLLVLESRGTISEKGTCVVSNGMAFVVRVVLEKVPDSKNGGTYDVELSDTVVVKDGEAMIRTKVARKLSEVLYEATEPEAFEQQQQRDLSRITRQGQATTVLTSREEQRDEQLKSLLRELHAELLAAGGKKGTQAPVEEFRSLTIGKLSLGEMQTFKPEESSPPQECQRGIHFQREKKVLWLPVCGQSVPFHVCTINKVEVKEEAEHQTLTITFHALQEANAGFKLNRTKVFVKELKYTSGRHDVFPAIQLAVQDAQRAVKNEDAAMKRSASSASSGKLEHATAPLRLPQVKMRPPLAMGRSAQNKGCVGDLQLHNNALLFTILSGPSVTMFFDNIKHIIFQPAVNSIYVIYHITLKKPIEVGTKTLTEIQFVAEVMESSEAASGARRSFDEEMDADQRDRARINATNKQFFNFARAVEEKSRIITQLPTTKFSFDGVHQKGMTTFKGSREVLWAVTELPPFTQSVEEVEVVSLERIIPGGSTFDMSLIFKDYNRNAVTISNIPTAHLEAVKDWCLSARLYYMESSVNPNWKVTMRDIRDDDEWDPWLQGSGWSLMNNDTGDGDEDEDGSSDSDSTYYEESDEESTDSDDSSWLEDEESDVDQGSDDEDDDSSASWDELDRKAEEHDRKHRRFSDDDEDRPRKRPRNAAAAAAAPAPAAPLARKAPASFAKSAVPPPRRF